MRGLVDIVSQLSEEGVLGELWVNGSFLTQKINPQDVDTVLCVASDFIDNASGLQIAKLHWLASNLRRSHLCDTYAFVEFPLSDPRYAVGASMRDYWTRQFGFGRANQSKGIAVVTLPLP
jgi:hypothetical protein